MRVETYFACVSPKGKVTVRYHCFPDHIKVCVDFSEVDMTSCQEILILNEQGATFFKKYSSGNEVLHDKKVGAWTRIDAEHAEFSDLGEHISFSVEKIDGATLYRGWEQVEGRFSWAGMTYALSPKTLVFNYTIRIQANTHLVLYKVSLQAIDFILILSKNFCPRHVWMFSHTSRKKCKIVKNNLRAVSASGCKWYLLSFQKVYPAICSRFFPSVFGYRIESCL